MNPLEYAYFAGGCFWCITPVFNEMTGVRKVTSGYSGGTEPEPSYEDVKNQQTGHRETICIEYNPQCLSFDTLLQTFLSNIDPFDPDGQFIDRGHSYTLAVYYLSEVQKKSALSAIHALETKSGRMVCVSVEPFTSFYTAEEEHQNFYLKHPEQFRQELIDSGRVSFGADFR